MENAQRNHKYWHLWTMNNNDDIKMYNIFKIKKKYSIHLTIEPYYLYYLCIKQC